MRDALRTVVVLVALALAWPARGAEEDARPWAEQPFLGLSVRDTPTGVVVAWILPGPLGGRGSESTSGIRRGDNLVSVDDRTVDAAGFQSLVKARRPGDEVLLVLRRSPEADLEAAVPMGGAGGEPLRVKAVLGDRSTWGGQVGRGLLGRGIPPLPEGAFEATLLEAAATAGVRAGLAGVGGGLDELLAHLAKVQEEALDPNALPAVVQAFRRPLSVDRVEQAVREAVGRAEGGTAPGIDALLAQVLDLGDLDAAVRPVMARGVAELAPAEVHGMVRYAGQHLEEAQEARGWRAGLEGLLATLRTSVYVFDDAADEHVRTINTVAAPHAEGLLSLARALLVLAPAGWEALASSVAGGPPLAELPQALRAAVEGDVLWVGEDPLGHWAVVGGPGPNRYDMGRVAAVYDVGGDDRYDYGRAATPVGLRLVIDLAGNDVHESAAPFEGPATAVLGLSWLDDRGGHDVYRTTYPYGVGAGLMGLGILVDHAGNDVYEATGPDAGWGLGVGFWGAGVVIDRDGHDVWRGERGVQGVGGPRGLGAVIDVKGCDLYVADGPHFGSAYGTPAVYLGMSQGLGFGIRGYAAGGVGALYDLEGNDRYEAGEFSQAGGYYFGLGILHDAAGHDLYHGNRYGQAFAAHQAIGILLDDAGDDTYWSMTAASQAGTWDESIGFLIDRAGHDAYRCDGLGQGGASMQAIAVLLDLAGDDRYSGSADSVQGQSGGNAYHYDVARVFSFSALLDLGGGRDVYSSGRTDGTTAVTGEHRPSSPGDSTLYGLFLDR